jgi:hypothetical protein
MDCDLILLNSASRLILTASAAWRFKSPYAPSFVPHCLQISISASAVASSQAIWQPQRHLALTEAVDLSVIIASLISRDFQANGEAPVSFGGIWLACRNSGHSPP